MGGKALRDGFADSATGTGDEGDARLVREMHRGLMCKEKEALASG